MIVDLHTHIWDSPDQLGRGAAQRVLRHPGQPWERPDASTSAHDAAMEPVHHAVIHGFESRYLGASISIEQVARYVARKPSKYLGFAGIDPLAGDVAAKVDQAKSLGLVGVTISPAAQGFHPSHSRAMALYQRCAELDLPLLVHGVTHLSPEAKLEFSQPYLLDEVAREFPKLRIIVAQVGYPWVEQTLVLIGKHRSIFADLSNVVTRPWQLYNVLLSAHQQGVTDRLLFGSDFPFCTPQKAITTIYSVNTLTQGTMLPSVPREQLRSIVERDVLEVLGIRKGEPAKASASVAAALSPISPAIAPAVASAVTPHVTPTAAPPAPPPAASAAPPVNPAWTAPHPGAAAPPVGANGSHAHGASHDEVADDASPDEAPPDVAEADREKHRASDDAASDDAASDERSTVIDAQELAEPEAGDDSKEAAAAVDEKTDKDDDENHSKGLEA